MRASLLVPSTAVILAGIAFSAPSLGQSPKDERSPEDRAKEFFDQGNALYDQDKPREAEEAYQKAWDLHRSHNIAANLGNVEMILGQKCEAVEHLQFAYDDFPPVGKPEEKERLLERLKEARRQMAYLDVKVDVAGAEVRVDGKPMGTSPLPRELCVEQGFRVVEATRAGYDGASQKSHAVNGLASVVELHLTPQPKSFFENRTSVLAVGAGLTALGLGVGIALAVDANAKRFQSRELQGQLVQGQCNDTQLLCLELDSSLESVDSSTNFSIAGFVGAGVAAVATGAYLVWPSSGPSAEAPAARGPAAALVPVITTSSGGLVAYGQF